MVYMSLPTSPTDLRQYATTNSTGKGLVLLDAAGVAELSLTIESANYMFQTPIILLVSQTSCTFLIC